MAEPQSHPTWRSPSVLASVLAAFIGGGAVIWSVTHADSVASARDYESLQERVTKLEDSSVNTSAALMTINTKLDSMSQQTAKLPDILNRLFRIESVLLPEHHSDIGPP